MIEGAIIGLIVAIVMIFYKKHKEKNAINKVMNNEVIDQPDFAAYFHCASEKTFSGKGFKFFDTNGVLTLNGSLLTYKPDQKNSPAIEIDLNNAVLSLAPQKRKMKWIEITYNNDKLYFTTFKQNAFSLDQKQMEEFLKLTLKE
ncbi:MAG: hypothetical protein H6600_08945 [Flavobacteriales bacterium]|nr:hypothetical protein [Flavobacteriales bacterium]MCB9198574.1 hypothetical protein [Flavobacteriales bacterium]